MCGRCEGSEREGCVAGVRAVRGWDVWQVKGTRRGVTSVLL